MPSILPLIALLIAALTPAAGETVQVTAEEPVAPLSPAAPEGGQSLGAMVTNGAGSLVFWSGMAGLYATPVTSDGKVGSRILITLSAVTGVSACWTGSVYLTTWQDYGDYSVHAATLSPDGIVVTPPTVVAPDAHAASGALASNGRRAVLAYATSTGSVKGALFDNSGAIVVTNLPLPVTNIASDLGGTAVPRVASDGDEFALIWRSAELVPVSQSVPPPLTQLLHTFHLQRIDDSANSIGAPITVAQTMQTGETFGVAYGGGLYAIDAIAGGKLVRFIVDPKTAAVTSLSQVDASGFVADVIWNGGGFIAYWMDYSQTSFALMTLPFSASETTPTQPVTAASGSDMAVSPLLLLNGSNVLGAWSECLFGQNAGESSIRGAVFDTNAAGTTSALFQISVGWSRQFAPAIATSGSDSLVVWIDSSAVSSGSLLGLRVAVDGTPIDSAPFEIGGNAAVGTTPLVTFAGRSYLVVWQELNGSGIVARRVGRDASLGSRITLGGYLAAVASTSNETLVAVTGLTGINGFRFNQNGDALDATPLTISSDGGHSPQAATNGTDFFVAWNTGFGSTLGNPIFSPLLVYGTRVSANGAVDASPLAIATAAGDDRVTLVGSNGRDYTVFYGLGNQLAAKRVLREGQLDGTTAQDVGAIVASNFYAQAIVSAAGGFWLAGTSGQYYSGSIVLLPTDDRGNAGTPVTLASYDTALMFPASVSLAQSPGGPLQIAYARRLAEGQYASTSRVFLRLAGERTSSRSRSARH